MHLRRGWCRPSTQIGDRWLVRTRALSSNIREAASAQDEVLRCIGEKVFDPAIPDRSIVDLGIVKRVRADKPSGRVSVMLEFPTAGHPGRLELRDAVVRALRESPQTQPWVREADVQVAASPPRSSTAPMGSGLTQVSHTIAVSSCKGGVGKSTVAVNLAVALARAGNRVGLLDADIYGPSLPTLLKAQDLALRPAKRNPKFVVPIDFGGAEGLVLRGLSFGHVSRNAGVPGAGGKDAAVLRGPLASKVLTQLLMSTEWGELDYLLLDMPPGTGDLQITVSQSLSLSGAVVVTTPQELALVDVLKGIAMFQDLKVPTLAVVENMAYFECGKCSERHRVFGQGAADRVLMAFPSIPRSALFELPLSPGVSRGNDEGRPITLTQPESAESQVYAALAAHIGRDLFRRRFKSSVAPQLSYDKARGLLVMRIFTADAAKQVELRPVDVRRSDPRTGEELPSAPQIPEDVYPEKFDVKGNYGVSVVWSDGHYASIYTFDALERMAERARLGPQGPEGVPLKLH